MRLNQVELYDANCQSRLVCWLPVDSRIKRRAILTLKEIPDRDWIVLRVFKTQIEDADMNRRWSVGGLR